MPKPPRFAQFPKQRRLLHTRQYHRVFSEGKRFSAGALVVLARRNTLGFPRLGLAIARKQVRHAVRRNRIKRLIRESFRLHQQELSALDVVVIARRGVDAMAARDVYVVLRRQWAKVRSPGTLR